MPYIVTTRENASTEHEAPGMRYFESRRAVATLEEARAMVPEADTPLDERGATYRMLDGTVIEVEWLTIDELAERAGISNPDIGPHAAADAYNAAQERN
jgi:hypothetical protein